MTFDEPIAIVAGGPTHVHMSPTRAAGIPPISDGRSARRGMIGPPTCGFGPSEHRAGRACRRRGLRGAWAPRLSRARRRRGQVRPRRCAARRGHALGDLGVREREVAGGDVAALLGLQQRLLGAADLLRLPAARVEPARRRRVGRRRHVAGEDLALLRRRERRVGDRHGRHQRARVRHPRVRVELVGVGQLDDLAEVHHRDAVAHVAHDREVVGDEDQRQAEVALEVAQQVEDLRLDRHVERGDRLVGDDQLRLERERARDADALALAAGELVRVAVVVLGVEPDRVHQLLDRALALALARRACRGSRTARR